MLMGGRFGTGDFARPNALSCRRSAAMAAASAINCCGFGPVETAACIHLDGGAAELVPASQLAEGDAEAIGDGDQRVTPPSGVDDGVSSRRRGWGDRDDERFHSI